MVEEKELEKKFGQAYLDYKKRVPMFIPGLRRG
jgi:protein-S-isoprenylcysteine O-methyltransferase Ste14